MKQRYIFPTILFLTFLVWAPTLWTYFFQDDWVFLSHVYKQPFLSVFRHYPEAFYRPMGQQLFFFLGSRIFGLSAQGFHLMGLLIHLFNVWLLSKVLNIWTHDRRVKYFLLAFYAVNPVHLVALNWLTQMDIEIAVSFGLLTILFWKRTILSLGFFIAALLSHETVLMLPLAMAFWKFKGQSRQTSGLSLIKSLIKSITYFSLGVLILIVKFLVNPFSPQSDYSLNFNLLQLLSTLKWYALRALMVPEGVRNLPAWMAVLSLVPGLILILMFRQKLLRGLGFYFLGALPVLGFGGHLLSAYAVFGVALMAIELSSGIPRLRDVRRPFARNGAVYLLVSAVILLAAIFIYSRVWQHWSTNRGLVSWRLTQSYIEADSYGRTEILSQARDFESNPEIYFSTMMGRQFEVLDRGVGRGIFGWLFYRGNDLTTQFLPDAEFFRSTILAGKFPPWNPWIFAGMPYFLDPQNFLWYLPNYIFLLTPVETGFLILLIGHLALAGWGVKRVLGEFGVFGRLAIFGGLMFVFSPKLVGYIEEGNWSLVIAACWLSILYLGLKKNKFWLTVLSLSAIIINNLNIGYYSVIFVILHYLLIQKRTVLAKARTVLKILIVTAVLTIPRWLPLVMFGGQTVRANLQEAPLPVWSWTKIAKSLASPLGAGHPQLQNEEILYLGIVPMGLLLYKGLSLRPQGQSLKDLRGIWFWMIWLGFVFLVALNDKTPLFHLIKWLPGFSLLRITTRPWIFASLGVALAVPMIIGKMVGPRTTFTCSRGLQPRVARARVRGSDVPADFLAKIRARPKNWSLLIKSTVVFLVMAEFVWFGRRIFERREIVSDPVPARFYRQVAAEGTLVRAYCTTGCLDRLTAQRMGIALLGGNNPIQLKSFVEYLQAAGGYQEPAYHPILPPYTVFNQQPQPKAELLAKTATKFVVSPYELTDENFELIDQEGNFRLYQNKIEMPEVKDHYFEL